MKVRMKFAKTGPLKYVGHLDLLRSFQKVFRRSNLPVAYSNGFNPHQILSFAAPLGIGVTSEGEYLDVELTDTVSTKEMIRKMNEACQTPYLKILSAVELEDTAKKAMAAVAGADYRITPLSGFSCDDWNTLLHSIDDFMAQTEIHVIKKTKKGEHEVDLRPYIHILQQQDQTIYMRVTTGSSNNVKPDFVIEKLCEFCHISYAPVSIQIHRLETFLWVEESEQTGRYEPLSYAGHEV